MHTGDLSLEGAEDQFIVCLVIEVKPGPVELAYRLVDQRAGVGEDRQRGRFARKEACQLVKQQLVILHGEFTLLSFR